MRYERLDKIMDLLNINKSINLDVLCEKLDVSKNTIRRDIAQLEQEGKIKKFYGGISLAESQNDPIPFIERESSYSNEKKQIAKIAADLVKPGDVIFIDSGTTTMHMVPYLAEKGNITIVTYSLNVMIEAAKYNLNLIATGGSLYCPSNSFVGSTVQHSLKQYNVCHAFMASSGISLDGGATNASPLESENKKFIMKGDSIKTLLIDHSKFDKRALVTYADLNEFDNIITSKEPDKVYKDYFNKNNINLYFG